MVGSCGLLNCCDGSGLRHFINSISPARLDFIEKRPEHTVEAASRTSLPDRSGSSSCRVDAASCLGQVEPSGLLKAR